MLRAKNLSISYGDKNIINDIDFYIEENKWTMLIGPNGCGKSTIVSSLAGSIPYQGSLTYKGKDLAKFKPKDKAKIIGILNQHNSPSYAYRVEDVIGLGRYPYKKSLLDGISEEDEAMVDYAIDVTGLGKLRSKSILAISGGELQRTFLAQVLAQDPSILILDEPVNHLDLKYQENIFKILKDWVKEDKRAILSVIHDLGVAKAYGDKAILIHDKKVLAQGHIDQVMTRDNLKTTYGIDVVSLMRSRSKLW